MYLFNSYIIVYFLYQAKTDELFHFIFQVASLQYLVSDSQKLGINIYPPEDQTQTSLILLYLPLWYTHQCCFKFL